MDMDQVEKWYDAYRTGIYRFALSLLKNPSLAEDVMQETFVRLIRNNELTFTDGKERAWLYRVARNLCYDVMRKHKKESSMIQNTTMLFSVS